MLDYNKKLKIVYLFYKIFGLGPFSLTGKRHSVRKNIPCYTYSYIGNLYNFFLIVIHITMYSFFVLDVDQSFDESETQLTKAILKFKLALGFIVLMSLWILLWIKQKKMVVILNKLVTIDTHMILKLNHIYCTKPIKYNYITICVMNLFMWILMIISDYQFGFIFSLTWWCFSAPGFVGCWLIMQYVFMVNVLQTRFRNFNNSITKLTDKINNFDNSNLFNDITLLKYMHNSLYEVSKDMSDFYSLPTLMVVTHYCVALIISSYYTVAFYMHSKEKFGFLTITNSMIYLSTETFPIVTLTNKITSLMEEVKKTAPAIHQLLNTPNINEKIKSQLRQFSIELLDKNMQFTAYEFFSLDNSLLYLVANTVMTYLIILVQFDGSGSQDEDHFANVWEDF